MPEKELYKSVISFGFYEYDIEKVRKDLLDYFDKNTKKVFGYLNSNIPHFFWGFHYDGMSIHVQLTNSKDNEPLFIDVTLVSDKTSTSGLEGVLKAIAKQHETVPDSVAAK